MENNYLLEIFKASPLPTLLLLPDIPNFTIIHANTAYLKLTHLEEADLTKKGIFEALTKNNGDVTAENRTNLLHSLRTVVETGKPHKTAFQRCNGLVAGTNKTEIRYLAVENIPVIDDKGSIQLIMHTVTDITEKKLQEEKIALLIQQELENVARNAAEKKKADFEMNLLVNNTEEVFILLDTELKIISFNQQLLVLYKKYFGREVIKGDSILDYASPERRTILQTLYEKVLAGNEEITELTIPVHDEFNKIFSLKYKPAFNEEGTIIGTFVTIKDVTEVALARKQMEASEEKYRLLFYKSPLSRWIFDVQSLKILDVNDAAIDHYGYTREEFLNMTINDLRPKSEIPKLEIAIREIIKNDGVLKKKIFTHQKKNGQLLQVEVSGNKFTNQDIDCILIVCNDVTERELALQQLKDRETKLQTAQKIAKLGYWEQNINDRQTLYWSEEMYHIWDVTPHTFETTFSNFYKSIHPDDREIFDAAQKIAKESKEPLEVQHRIILTNGTIKYLNVKGNYVYNEENNPIRIEGTIQDITPQKLLALSLETSNQRYNYVTKATFEAIWDWDLLTQNLYWSEGFQTIFGYKVEELKPTISSWTDHIHPEDIERVISGINKVIDGNQSSWMDEYRYLKSDQTYAYVIDKGFVIRDEHGKAINMVGAMQDITKRKNDEFALQQSEARLRGIINSQTNYILRTDLSGNYTYYNQKFMEDFGWIHNEVDLMGVNSMSSIKEYHHQRVIDVVEKCFINLNEVFQVELDKLSRNGDTITTLWDFTCLTDSNGQPTEIQCVGIDISARKKAEKALMDTLEEKNIILESIGDAFFAVDHDWTVTYWNNQAEKLLNVPKNKIVGHYLWEVFSDRIDSESYRKYSQAIQTRQVVHFEDYYDILDKWYEISAYPSDNGLSVYFKDVTERKFSEIRLNELNESLQIQAKKLAISNTELEQFAYIASHDLQEPLRMVTSFLTQLEKKYGDIIDEKGKKYIYFAVDGAKRMRQIILDLLEYSRVGRTEDSAEELNLNELVNGIQLLFRKQLEEKKASIKVGKLPVVHAYRSPLHQVFQNLISNALKYTKENVPAQLAISAKEFKNYWQFAVADNGIGINEEYFDKIFVIFQRLHNKDEYSGTGVGLAVTKKIVENLGGKIWVESEEGQGSIFYFTLVK